MTADPTPPSADLSNEALDALEKDLRRKVTLGTGVVTPLRIQAADAITALRAENEALRSCCSIGMDLSNHHNAQRCPYCSAQAVADREASHSRVREAEARATAAEAALAAAMEGAVRVKPLIWGGEFWDTAETPFCSYGVTEVGDERWRWWRSEYPYHFESDPDYATEDAAKAAAQADYERRILAALEPNSALHGPLWRSILSAEDCLNRVCDDTSEAGSCLCGPKIDRIEAHARSAVLTQPQTAALAAVRREARAPLIGALRGCIDTAEMVAADLQSRRNCAGIDMNAASLLANNSEALPILAAAEKEAATGERSSAMTALAVRDSQMRTQVMREALAIIAKIERDETADPDGILPPDRFDEGTSAAYEAIEDAIRAAEKGAGG